MRVILRWFKYAVGLGVIAASAGLWITRPNPLPETALSSVTGDPIAGEGVFAAAGCASCHSSPDASGEARLVLSGGRAFASDFGVFYAPNISPDPTHGIGEWSDTQIASALLRGVGREGAHLYPALPYAAYNKMTLQDAADLIAYLRTLPSDQTPNKPHDIGFPFNIRLALGGWKLLFERSDFVVTGDLTPEQTRGRYLVEALGHCGECHTPRNALGGLQRDAWLSGAAIPGGNGRTPNITPAKLGWSEAEIVEYLTSGFTPDFDTAGGEMAEVVKNTATLPIEDRAAIAAYLKVAPAIE